jgi:uncharacterized membrane protein
LVEHTTDTGGVPSSNLGTRTMQEKFSIGEALHVGWQKWREEINFILMVALINLAIAIVLNLFSNGTAATKIIADILSILFSIIISLGIIKSVLMMADDEHPTLEVFRVEDFKTVLWYILASLAYIIMVAFGTALFIVPGLILAIRFKFYSYLIIEKQMNALDALKRSWEITKGSTWNLVVFAMVTFSLNMVAVFAFLLGLIVTVPVTYIAIAYIYKKLENSEHAAAR